MKFGSANGAKCKSLEQRPRKKSLMNLEPLKERNRDRDSLDFAPTALAIFLVWSLGRCPRLLHFAPLALRSRTHHSSLITFIGLPVRNESRMRKVARVVASSSGSVIGAGRPDATTAQATRVSSACPLSCCR